MIPFMFYMAADTVIAPYDEDYDIVHVHEWGVVELCEDEGTFDLSGAAWGEIDSNGEYCPWLDEEVEEKAPVVWFYGPDFTGDFRVEVTAGRVVTRYPEVDSADLYERAGPLLLDHPADIHRVVWSDISATSSPPPSGPEAGTEPLGELPFGWASEQWRTPPALYLSRSSDGWSDRFIYYECSVEAELLVFPDALTTSRDWFAGRMHQGPALLFRGSGDAFEMHQVHLSEEGITYPGAIPESSLQGPEEVQQVLCNWAGGELKSEEIEALWNTWGPVIESRCAEGRGLLLFPLDPHLLESMCRIELVVDQGYEVRYSRLVLVLTEVP